MGFNKMLNTLVFFTEEELLLVMMIKKEEERSVGISFMEDNFSSMIRV